MRVLGAIVQVSALAVLDAGKQLAPGDAVASQLVGHDHPRHKLQALQQPFKEALRGFGIAPVLDEDIEHNAGLIDGTPEIVEDTLDPDEYLVQMPLVPGPWPATAHAVAKLWPNFLHQRRTVS